MLENTLVEMATQLKGSVQKGRKLRLVFVYLFICINQSHGKDFTSIYQSADHYWPLNNISDNTSLDTISLMHAEIINGAKLNHTKLFGAAVFLDGDDDWITLGLMNEDCTNMPSECHDGFTISFWIYYMGGEFLLCTGAYRGANKGPGIKFTFGDEQNMFRIEVSTLKYTWKTTSKLVVRKWVHVAFKWSSNGGVHLYLNGSAAKQKAFPKQEVTFVKPEYSHGWSIGRPNEIFKLTKYGSFGIAHLAQWLRELTAVEIRAAFYETILHGKPTTAEQPTSRAAKFMKPSKGPRSKAESATYYANFWSTVAASILFLVI